MTRFRALTSADLDAVAAITLRCNRHYEDWAPAGWTPPTGDDESERTSWADILAGEEICGLLALDRSGRPVGVAVAEPRGELRRLFVDLEAQRHGIGSELLRRIEAALGVEVAGLWAVDESPAIEFYEANGWHRDGRERWHERLGLPLIGMSKRL